MKRKARAQPETVYESPFTEVDFSNCRDPKAAVAAFLKEVGSTIISEESGGAIDICASAVEGALGHVTVFASPYNNPSKDLWEGVSHTVFEAECEARQIGNARRKRSR